MSVDCATSTSEPGQLAKLVRILIIGLFLLILAVLGSYGYFALAKVNLIADGVTINTVVVGGLTPQQAKGKLQTVINDYSIKVSDGEKIVLIKSAPTNNLAEPQIWLSLEPAVTAAYAYSNPTNPIMLVMRRTLALLLGQNFTIPTSYDRGAMVMVINNAFTTKKNQPRDAEFIIRVDEVTGMGVVAIAPEKSGRSVDGNAVLADIDRRAASLSATPVATTVQPQAPGVTAAMLRPLKTVAETTLNLAPIILMAQNNQYTAGKEILASWLTAGLDPDTKKMKLILDRNQVSNYLIKITQSQTLAPIDAVFKITAGKVTNFRPSENGTTVDINSSLDLLNKLILNTDFKTVTKPALITLPFQTVAPKTPTEASNPYGIKEIIGVGSSNFRGSPKNRQSNIATGAKQVSGTIIEKGSEFSLLKTLGEISEKTGYLQELVIKKDKTTPEFGGGLCQIGTTTFRATLNAGLPITMRQNHSYRVVYYERDGDGNNIGPGTDATIYDPSPDFRFVNDTSSALLLLTNITANKITFTFWGVKDGRKAEQTKPVVTNELPPPPPKLLETTDLPVGNKKCTEKAHKGGSASFLYTITYKDGATKKKTFKSIYKPWGEVCLVGVKTLSNPLATSTPLTADTAGATGN